jgi:putative endonuclease
MPEGHVYILGSTTGTIYTGVTSQFDRRIFEHKNGIKLGFASRYHCNRLLLHERFTDIRSAIAREKQIKGWTRAKKLALIAQTNPEFKDLAAQLGWKMLHPQQDIADQKYPGQKESDCMDQTESIGILRFAQDDNKNNKDKTEKR